MTKTIDGVLLPLSQAEAGYVMHVLAEWRREHPTGTTAGDVVLRLAVLIGDLVPTSLTDEES